MIVITGASDGLGLQLAKLYQEAGKKVVNISRRPSRYADVNIELSLREGEQIQEAADRVVEIDDKLEALVHCAGVMSFQRFGEITEEEIKRLMSTNVKPQLLLTSLLKDRILTDETDIVCVSTTGATKGTNYDMVYGPSKWAVRGFAKGLQVELKDKPNRVISFCPGGFKSDIGKKVTGREVENPDEWMSPEYIALFMKQILDLPKDMEVSEVIINRRSAR